MNFGFKIRTAFFDYFKQINAEFYTGATMTGHDMILDGAFSLQMKT